MPKNLKYLFGAIVLGVQFGLLSGSALADENNFYINTQLSNGPTSNSLQNLEMSADGQFQIVWAKGSGSGIFVSTDYGQNWSKTLDTGYHSMSVGVSANGKYMVAGGISGMNSVNQLLYDGQLFYSSDYGQNWELRSGAGNRRWGKMDISNDGARIFALIEAQQRMENSAMVVTVEGTSYYSTNSGNSFTLAKNLPASDYADYWEDFDMSDDGLKVFMVAPRIPLWSSMDGGATWTEQTSTGATLNFHTVRTNSSGSRVWYSGESIYRNTTANSYTSWTFLDSDYYADFEVTENGKYFLARSSRWQRLVVSRDYGATWSYANFRADQPGGTISFSGFVLAMSADGQHGAVNDGTPNYYVMRNGANYPPNPAVTSGNGQLTISWGSPGTNGSTISDYEIQMSTDGGATWGGPIPHTASTTRSRTITGLTNGVTYTIKVAAVTEWGVGQYTGNFDGVPYTVPGAPTGLTGTVQDSAILLDFTRPTNDGGNEVRDFKIEYSSGGAYSTFADSYSNSAQVLVTGLTNGTAYTFRVTGENLAGWGATSEPSAAYTPAKEPSKPETVTAVIGSQSVRLNWNLPASNGGSAITDYLVQYSSNGGSTWNDFSGSVSTSRFETVTALTNGSTYSFRVFAVNSIGASPASSVVSATPSTTASAPTSLSVNAGNGQASISFTAGANGGNSISDYLVEYSSDSGATWNIFSHTPTTTSPIVVTGLTNYTRYTFRLTPINVNGNGATSSATSSVMPGGVLTSVNLTRQSVGTASGSAFTTQPQVTLQDQYSATLLSDSSTVVTASISAGGVLVGTTTATAVSGVATFSGLGMSGTSGTSYTVSYSVTGLTSVTQTITSSVGPASKLRISRNSAGTQTSTAFTTQPIIKIVDSGNNVVTSYQNTTITSSVNNQTCFIGLVDTVTATSGSATFSGLSLSGASGTECLITYSASNLTSTSETVTLLAGAAGIISRTTRPDYGYYGRPFGQQPVYTITDFGGNIVTTDNTTVLTITTPNNSGSTILQETQTAVNGIVTFTGLGFSGINAGTFVMYRVSADSFSFTYTDSINMMRGDPVLSWSNFSKLSGDAPFTITAPTSNAAGTFSYSSSNTEVATVSGSTITITGQGSTTLSATLAPSDTTNFNSGVSVTTTLSVSAGAATVTISLAGGVVTVAKGTAIAITASVNVTGKVSFYVNGKPIGGCASRHTTSSVNCTWKPTRQGQSVTLSALLKPSSSNYTIARSNLLQVGVGRRTGRR